MMILNSPGGPSGTFCGTKTGYATLLKAPDPKSGKDLKLVMTVQGPSYRWNIKITQLPCDQVIHVLLLSWNLFPLDFRCSWQPCLNMAIVEWRTPTINLDLEQSRMEMPMSSTNSGGKK